MKILLTGATGFIGTNFILSLHEKYQITALVRQNSNISKIKDKCEIYCLSESNENNESNENGESNEKNERSKSGQGFKQGFNEFQNFLKEREFDGVLHLATLYLKTHKPSDIKALINSNITFGAELLESLKQVNFKGFFININSFWQIYKNAPQNPLNLYAATKNAFLQILNYYAQTSEILISNVYLNDTYGPNDTRNKIFNLWLKSLKTGEVLEMSGGEQIMDILHVKDILKAFEILIKLCSGDLKELVRNKNFALHSNERMSLKEVSNIFEKSLNVKLNIKWGAKPYSTRENFIPYEFGDKLPNFAPQISLEKGFKMVFDAISSSSMGGGGCKCAKLKQRVYILLTPCFAPYGLDAAHGLKFAYLKAC